MQIAVITITRNNVEGLRRTITSVRCQTYADILHVIIDGDSTDGTAEVLDAERRNGTAMVETAPPAGVYDAINRGIRVASDDVVAQVAEAFDEGDIDFVYGDLHYSRAGSDKVLRYYGAAHFTPAMLRQGYAPGHPTLYLTRRAAQVAGPYDTGFRVGGDFEMWLRLFEHTELRPRYLPLDMVCMDTGGLSQRWYSRLVTNNRERLRSFRMHGLPASHLNILRHYTHVLKSFICRKQR